MKAHRILWLLSILILYSCNQPNKETPSENNASTETEAEEAGPMILTTLSLSYEASTQFRDMKITVKSIEDSRCVQGAQCSWPGTAMVFLKVQRGGAAINKAICDWDARKHVEGCDNLAEIFGYIFKVDHVLPYPTMQYLPTLDDYVVNIQIGK